MPIDSSDLKSLGLKVTGPRMKILDIFQKHATQGQRHLSAEDVFTLLKNDGIDVGLATGYRVLSQFEVAGLLRRHHFDADHAMYELEEAEHHDHLVCLHCGHVEEFVDDEIERRQREIAARHGFVLREHALSLYGLCAACQAKLKDR